MSRNTVMAICNTLPHPPSSPSSRGAKAWPLRFGYKSSATPAGDHLRLTWRDNRLLALTGVYPRQVGE